MDEGPRSKRLIEAKGIEKSFGDKVVLAGIDVLITPTQRGVAQLIAPPQPRQVEVHAQHAHPPPLDPHPQAVGQVDVERRLDGVHNYISLGIFARSIGGQLPKNMFNRFELHQMMIDMVTGDQPLYLEFGVHEGKSFRFWCEKLPTPGAARCWPGRPPGSR